MKITYLGSAALRRAGSLLLLPLLPYGTRAGRPQKRLRSSVLINDDLLIDLTPIFLTVYRACGPLDGCALPLTHAHGSLRPAPAYVKALRRS